MADVPLLLVHGQPGSHRDWTLLLPLLRGRTVLAPDRPGYDGRPAGGYWYNAEALIGALDAAGVGRAVLVGHSWGAGPALVAALEHPDRVAGLVLVAPVGSPSAITTGDRILAMRGPSAAVAWGMPRLGARAAFFTARAVGSRLPEAAMRTVLTELRQSDLRAAWAAWRVEQRAMVADTPALAGRLNAIDTPAIVVAGHRDPTVTPQAARALARRLPRASYREVDAGHLVPLERPAAVAAAIRDVITDPP